MAEHASQIMMNLQKKSEEYLSMAKKKDISIPILELMGD